MPSNRIVFQNWIADLGRDPLLPAELKPEAAGPSERAEHLAREVRKALGDLSGDERELVEQVHFMGRSCAEIAGLTGRAEHRLEALHRRALRKLRRKLAPLVKELYGIETVREAGCPICASPYRAEIDRLIAERDPQRTWRPVRQKIETDFGIRITTPQVLIGHEKYH